MTSVDECRSRAARLKLMAFDVDGVLTDGSLYFTDTGAELKAFNVRDGQGMRMLQSAGVTLAVITGRESGSVAWRARNLGIEHVRQGVGDKLTVFHDLIGELGIGAEQAGFMGDDVIDLQVMDHCGFSAAPANAHPLAKQYARLVTEHTGGFGAAREVYEFILEAQGKLDAALAPYLPQSHSAAEK